MNRRKKKLEAWKFAAGETQECLADAKMVTVPHTWNVEEGLYEYAGSGWYAYQLTMPTLSEGKRYWLEFGAVYHDARVYVNGILAGQHLHSGYNSFTVEITDYIKTAENQIVVRADNSFSEEMLPYRRSFDWANDGGMIRSVWLYETGAGRIANVRAVCEPILTQTGKRQRGGSALWGFDLELDIRSRPVWSDWKIKWRLYSVGKTELASEGEASVSDGENQAVRQILDDVSYWHFDAPTLYVLELELCCGDVVQDTYQMKIGFRQIEVRAEQLFLNGEPVRLCGTEWMPGSSPQYGMAEPTEQLYKMLDILRKTNCVYTRFHWQQSEEVYEWCDEHGMLVQEEIPFWGPEPEAAGETQWEIFCQQMQEMVRAKQNHPKAEELLRKAFVYPENLGEGKLEGTKDNHLYYHLGLALEGQGRNAEAEECFRNATLGTNEPAGAMYYNDQPADMILYQGLSYLKLGMVREARARFYRLIDYGERHLNDEVKIQYFAVSLPEFLIFDEDYTMRNRAHCYYLMALGNMGLGDADKASMFLAQAVAVEPSHMMCRVYQAQMQDR